MMFARNVVAVKRPLCMLIQDWYSLSQSWSYKKKERSWLPIQRKHQRCIHSKGRRQRWIHSEKRCRRLYKRRPSVRTMSQLHHLQGYRNGSYVKTTQDEHWRFYSGNVQGICYNICVLWYIWFPVSGSVLFEVKHVECAFY